jgi:hypothetical protein
MLRRVWAWLVGTNPTSILLSEMVEQNARTNAQMMQAITQVVSASEKQAEVLGKYLDLFKSPDDPRRWQMGENADAENLEEMVKMGFPAKGTDAEQADWVLQHLDRL